MSWIASRFLTPCRTRSWSSKDTRNARAFQLVSYLGNVSRRGNRNQGNKCQRLYAENIRRTNDYVATRPKESQRQRGRKEGEGQVLAVYRVEVRYSTIYGIFLCVDNEKRPIFLLKSSCRTDRNDRNKQSFSPFKRRTEPSACSRVRLLPCSLLHYSDRERSFVKK